MAVPTQDLNHVAEGIARLIEQYKALPNIQNLLTCYLRSVQDLENTIWQVINARLLANATGAQLDVLGRIVGEPRWGRTDLEYRRAIQVRVLVNSSDGRPEDILAILAAATANDGNSHTINYLAGSYPACFSCLISNFTAVGVTTLLPDLTQAREGGVRGVFEYTLSTFTGTQGLLCGDIQNAGNVPGEGLWDDATHPGTHPHYAAGAQQF